MSQTGIRFVSCGARGRGATTEFPWRAAAVRHKSAGSSASGQQRLHAQAFPWLSGVEAPIVDDQQYLCPNNPAEHYEDAKVPDLLWIHALAACNVHAHP